MLSDLIYLGELKKATLKDSSNINNNYFELNLHVLGVVLVELWQVQQHYGTRGSKCYNNKMANLVAFHS